MLQTTNKGTRVKVLRYAVYQGSAPERWQTKEQTKEQSKEQSKEQLEKNIRSKEVKKKRERVKREKRGTKVGNPQKSDGKPSLSALVQFVEEEGLAIDPNRFWSYYEEKNWKGVTDWKERARTWAKTERKPTGETLPDYYTAEQIRDPAPVPATDEQIAEAYQILRKGKQ
jgi:hypothetical protein